MNVDVGHNGESGTLNLGSDVTANGRTLTGTVTVSETGTANGAEYGVNGGIDVSGAVNVNDGATLNANAVTLTGGTVNVTGTMNADTLTGDTNSLIMVGNELSAGSLSVGSLVCAAA